MSNYLSQIAARNAGANMPLLTPGHSPVETALNDPFNQAATAPGETGRAMEVTPTATITPAANRESITVAQPVNDPVAKATGPEQPETIKPAYLSKYIERDRYYTREHTNTVLTKEPGNKDALRTVAESPVLSIFPTVPNSAATSDTAAKQTATPQKSDPVQQQHMIITTALLPVQQSSIPEKSSATHEQPAVLQPVVRAAQQEAGPVLLQPPVPVQPAVTPQKENPVPALVIGKITVEIVPAQKPVNKIINHVVKPQPSATPSTQRNKNSFGLGQL